MAEKRQITFQTYRSICGGKVGRDCHWNDCTCRVKNCTAWKQLRKIPKLVCIESDGTCQATGKPCTPDTCNLPRKH